MADDKKWHEILPFTAVAFTISEYYHSNLYFAKQPEENVVEFNGTSYFPFFCI